MGEGAVVELAQSFAIVYGIAHNDHSGEGELVVLDYADEVFKLTAIDALVFPCQLVAGGNRCLWSITAFEKLLLYVFNNAGTEEDAHGALVLGEHVELFLVGHWRASLAACEDDGLAALWYGELAAQLGCCRKERRNAWSDVVVHSKFVEECHLLLYGSVDAWVASMESDNEFAAVVEFLHQGELFVEIHVG